MHIISRKRIVDFKAQFPDSSSSLLLWYKVMKTTKYANFAELRKTFPSADTVGQLTVFNISGNKYRIIAAVHYNRSKVFIRHILTHSEYDKAKWRK